MFPGFKDAVRGLLRPLAALFYGINPNTLTLLGLGMGLGAGYFFALSKGLLGGLFLLAAGFFDVLDGAVAREQGRVTPFGGFLDSVTDRYGDAAVFLGLMYGDLIDLPGGWLWGGLALVGSLMVSYTRARAEAAGVKIQVGIAERAERMLIIILGAFLERLGLAVMLVAVLSHLTVLQRILQAKKEMQSKLN